MSKLMFSIVVTVSGNLLAPSFYESDLRDYVNDFNELLGPSDATDPGDSEYHYLAKEDRCNPFKEAIIEALDGGNKKIADWAIKRYENDSSIWWATCSDYQNSGIIDSRKFFEFLKYNDLLFEDCGTLGTLGGPLSIGCVPDVAFTSESQQAIVSLRVTPFIEVGDEIKPVTEATWERLKHLYKNQRNINRKVSNGSHSNPTPAHR
jgi:hypothetical protein